MIFRPDSRGLTKSGSACLCQPPGRPGAPASAPSHLDSAAAATRFMRPMAGDVLRPLEWQLGPISAPIEWRFGELWRAQTESARCASWVLIKTHSIGRAPRRIHSPAAPCKRRRQIFRAADSIGAHSSLPQTISERAGGRAGGRVSVPASGRSIDRSSVSNIIAAPHEPSGAQAVAGGRGKKRLAYEFAERRPFLMADYLPSRPCGRGQFNSFTPLAPRVSTRAGAPQGR